MMGLSSRIFGLAAALEGHLAAGERGEDVIETDCADLRINILMLNNGGIENEKDAMFDIMHEELVELVDHLRKSGLCFPSRHKQANVLFEVVEQLGEIENPICKKI